MIRHQHSPQEYRETGRYHLYPCFPSLLIQIMSIANGYTHVGAVDIYKVLSAARLSRTWLCCLRFGPGEAKRSALTKA